MMKNIYSLILCLLVSTSIFSQDYTANWEGLFSYYNITDLHYSNNLIFASAKNSVFSYNLSSGEVKTFSTVNGLSGEDISAVHYSSARNLLLVGYETGLINVYNISDGSSLQVIDITEKETVSPAKRRVNDFYEIDNQLLISTNYGISVYNLNNLEFGDTYFIGDGGEQLGVNQIVVKNNVIYAATQGGSVRYAALDNPNLIDFSQWSIIPNLITLTHIQTFKDKLLVISDDRKLFEIQSNSSNLIKNLNGKVNDFIVEGESFFIVYTTKIDGFNEQFNKIFVFGDELEFLPSFTSLKIINNSVFVGDSNQGLIKTYLNESNYSFISPEGPLRNSAFSMEAIPNELWVSYGDYNLFFNPYNPNLKSYGLSHLENDSWINIPFEDITANNLVNIAINPRDVANVFVSSFNDGLIEIQDNEVISLFDQNNSPIEELIDKGNPVANDTRVNGLSFDNNGVLWGNVSRVKGGLFSYSTQNQSFNVYDISRIIPEPNYYSDNLGFSDLVTDQTGNVYFGSYEYGVIGFQPSTNTFGRIIGNESAGNLPDNFVRTLALDNNNQLWIGTVRGIRVLFNPSSMFTNQNTQAQEIIILDDDGVAQELLANVSITDIEVDGNNNKWIATESGAFYLSSNGQETIYNFTTANSPIPSNNVNDIEVDGSSGEVYIGTEKGIVVFKGTATSSQETLENVRAFPNPVRPNYSGMVTIDGLIENANVKITDIEGNLVYEEVSQGGSIQWDTRAFGKYKVASGVYMVLITSADQIETKVTKIMVIR